MAAQYANRPIPATSNNYADLPPPTVVIDLPPPAQPPVEDDVPSYLPPRVSSFKQPPPLSQSPPGNESALNTNAATGADEDPTVRNVVIAQTAIRGWLARKEYKDLYAQNRWRLEAPKIVAPRLVSPAKDKVMRKSRPPSRGFKADALAQHHPDPEPSGTPDTYLEGHEPQEEDKPRAPVRKSYAPGMLAPGGMGIGEFDPSMVRLKSAPRPVSMDLKIAAQSPPLKHPNLKPVPAHISTSSGTPQTKSMPDMPALKKPPGHSPLAADGIPPPPPPDSPPHHATLAVPESTPKKASPAVPKKPGPKMVLPPDWEMHVDIQGRKYYYNLVNQETTWTPPPMVPEHTVVKKIKSPQQYHSQNNLFGNLEMLIPQHKFAPQVPKKPPPPPTTGTPPPPEHSPLPATPLSPDTPPLIAAPPLSLDAQPSSSSSTTTSTTSTHPPEPAHATLPAASGTSVQPASSSNSVNSQHPPLERTSSEQHRDKRSALRKLLDAFLGRRPSKDELVKRGVLHDDDPKKDAKEKKKLEKERKKKEKEEKKKDKSKK